VYRTGGSRRSSYRARARAGSTLEPKDPGPLFGDANPRIIRTDGRYWIRRPGKPSLLVGDNLDEARRALRDLLSKRRRAAKSAVYLVEGVPGWLRVGHAASPHLRLTAMRTANPFRLRLARVVWCRDAEWAKQRILDRFAEVRGEGEWLRDLPAVRQAVADLESIAAA
jgi:hypothetical protein